LYSTDDERFDDRSGSGAGGSQLGVPGRALQLVRPERSFLDTLAGFSRGLVFGGAPDPYLDEAF